MTEARQIAEACRICGGKQWVCENHPDRPWGGTSAHPDACECGAGQPCICSELSFYQRACKELPALEARCAAQALQIKAYVENDKERTDREVRLETALRELLENITCVTGESKGVIGWHLNGNVADWDEFDELHGAVARAEVLLPEQPNESK